MSDTHDKLQYANNYNHWKILDLFLHLKYFSFSNPTQTLTRHTYLNTKAWALIISFLSVFKYVEYHSVHAHIAWSKKFRLTLVIRK